MIGLIELKAELLRDPDTRRAYESLAPEFAMLREWMAPQQTNPGAAAENPLRNAKSEEGPC